MKQELINKMAEAIYNANPHMYEARLVNTAGGYDTVMKKFLYSGLNKIEKLRYIIDAKAALAAIQEDYVLLRKKAVEVVDENEWKFFTQDDPLTTSFILNNKPAINKKNIVE